MIQFKNAKNVICICICDKNNVYLHTNSCMNSNANAFNI